MLTILSTCFAGTRHRLGPANCLFVQLPLTNRFLTSFSRQSGIQLPLRFVEGCLGIHSGPAGRVIGLLHLFGVQPDLRVGDLGWWITHLIPCRAVCFPG